MKEKIQWYWYRLQRMSSNEVLHRLQEQIHHKRDENYQSPPLNAKLYDKPLPRLSFPDASLIDTECVQRLREDINDLWVDYWTLLGVQRAKGMRCDWGVDPSSEKRWPMEEPPHGIDHRHAFHGIDIKLAWEHLKLQHLQLFSYGVGLWNDVQCRTALLNDIEDWLENTQPFRGIGYASGIECALRVMSVLTINSWVETDFFPVETRRKLWQRLHDLYHWILRYPSLYSSENNHRVAELSVIFILELLVPEWRPIPIAQRARELECLCRKQFYDDGVNKEQSLHYQALVMEWMLVTSSLCRERAFPFAVDDVLVLGAGFLHAMLDEEGHSPNIGDADDSLIIRSQLAPENYVLNICCAAICYSQEDLLLSPKWKPAFREALLHLKRTNGQRSAKSQCFVEGGYTIFRHNGVMLVFDHGEIGFPELPGHGHSDALSIWLHVNDLPLLIDSGTAHYNLDSTWRSWFRGTKAHNTICIAQQNQSLETGPFNWSKCATSHLEEVSLDCRQASAWHDGYSDLGIVHRRKVEVQQYYIAIIDELQGEGRHQVELSFHFSSQVELNKRGEKIIISHKGKELASFSLKGVELSCQIIYGAETADRGVHSIHYNHVAPNPCLLWSGELQLPCSWQLHWVWISHPKEIWNEH